MEQNKGVEEITAEAYQGDIVGCGFDITDVTFDDTGVPKCNQTLRVYFTRNGGEVCYPLSICTCIWHITIVL